MTSTRTVTAIAALAASLTLGACFPSVDVDKADVADYQTWFQVVTRGDIPGHGDSERVIYVNPTALAYAGAGDYPFGSVLVKEIYTLTNDQRGDLDYISVMRKLADAPSGGSLHDGWLLTFLDGDINSEELYLSRCWTTCHASAPYDGVYLRYGEVTVD